MHSPSASNLVYYCSGATLEHVNSLRENNATGKNVTPIVVHYNRNRTTTRRGTHTLSQRDSLVIEFRCIFFISITVSIFIFVYRIRTRILTIDSKFLSTLVYTGIPRLITTCRFSCRVVRLAGLLNPGYNGMI